MRLRTAAGDFSADRLVLAQNAWAQTSREFRRQVLPVYTYQAVTRRLTASEYDSLGWESRAAFSDRRSILINFRLTRDNRILFGGRDIVQPFGGRLTSRLDFSQRILRLMRESFDAVFPAMADVPFETMWGGPIALTPTHLPRVGVLDSAPVVYAHGCGGHGVAQSFLWSGAAVDLLFGEKTPRTMLPFTRPAAQRYPVEPIRFLGGRATRRQLRWHDDSIGSGRKGDREPSLLALANRVFARQNRPR